MPSPGMTCACIRPKLTMTRSLYILIAGIGIGVMIARRKSKHVIGSLSPRAQALRDKYKLHDEDNGTPVPPMGRDSGLSTQISPEAIASEF